MKMKASLFVLLLAISIFAAIPMIAQPTNASHVYPGYPDNLYSKVKWATGGKDAAASLASNPEYLQLYLETDVYTQTWIHIFGKDAYGQPVEAITYIAGSHDNPVPSSTWLPFVDIHSFKPVAFSEIDDIFQENGTHCNSFAIYTLPEPWEDYLGIYHAASQYLPGQMFPAYTKGLQYLIWNGASVTIQDVPVEPSNPDPLKIVINWFDAYKTLGHYFSPADMTDPNEWLTSPMGATSSAIVYLEGLDERGMKLGGIATIDITKGLQQIVDVATYEIPDGWVPDPTKADYGTTGAWVPAKHTWSTVCKVWGGVKSDEYYIFTHPKGKVELFEYFIRIDHITLTPAAWDILANPNGFSGFYPGVTTITVALRDEDGNLVHAPGNIQIVSGVPVNVLPPIIVNLYASGGKIQPSRTEIEWCHVIAVANLTADTNPRTINVTADINVPACPQAVTGAIPSPELNLGAFVELTFDGINSVGPQRDDAPDWPVHKLMCGYYTYGQDCWKVFPAPFPDPVLPLELGGPAPNSIKLDGPLYEISIPLWVGCNLICSPVVPMFGPTQYYPLGQGIPMDLLFSLTSATTCIEAIWWYDASTTPGTWHIYIPGISDPTAYFVDGVGYWIKAEKPCTLEISGVLMENAPFTPREYPVYHSWNLMGFTGLDKMATDKYLESLASDTHAGSASIASAVGPVWVYDAPSRTWERDPDFLWPFHGFWMNYKQDFGDLAP
jgi:hypothetical protein